ncbi:MAG: hypothetical protein ACTHK1_01120, partial [Actinomycetales bacterium]
MTTLTTGAGAPPHPPVSPSGGDSVRLTHMAHGGGCACKIPPGELEAVVAGLRGSGPVNPLGELLVGVDTGDDAA